MKYIIRFKNDSNYTIIKELEVADVAWVPSRNDYVRVNDCIYQTRSISLEYTDEAIIAHIILSKSSCDYFKENTSPRRTELL